MSVVRDAVLANEKVKDLDELAVLVRDLKAQGRRIVHCHGVFDLLHVGHIRHLQHARALGDVLVVTVTKDEYVNKGPHRPTFGEQLRAEAVAALGAVDYVAINRWPQSVETIVLLKPDIYVKGAEYRAVDKDVTGGISREIDAVRSVGGHVWFTDDITFSSSTLLNRHFSVFTPEVDAYLEAFRARHSIDEVLGWLDRAASLRPLVVGEAIIDEYVFCEGIGKSTKDPVLAALLKSEEKYAGGSLAVANHLAGLCREVGLVTQLGDQDRREPFVRSTLRPNVTATLLMKTGAPTLQKRRIVDTYSGNKLLELYVMNDEPTSGADADDLRAALTPAIGDSDLVVAADYGHGMLTPDSIAVLCGTGRFLALNVQSNAGNRGFNPVSKYPRADYVCLAKHEIAIETRRRDGDVRQGVLEVASRIDCPRFTVTQGKDGSLHYDPDSGFVEAPALARTVADRVGAGDAVLAVTSLLVHLRAPWSIVALVGNVAGAQLVGGLGNRIALDRVSLAKHISALLK